MESMEYSSLLAWGLWILFQIPLSQPNDFTNEFIHVQSNVPMKGRCFWTQHFGRPLSNPSIQKLPVSVTLCNTESSQSVRISNLLNWRKFPKIEPQIRYISRNSQHWYCSRNQTKVLKFKSLPILALRV